MINRTISLFEYRKKAVTSSPNDDGVFRLTSGEIEKIEKLSEHIKLRDRLSFAPVYFNYRAEKACEICSTCYVGLLKVNNKIIEVLPKMAQGEEGAEHSREAVRNLLYMLSYTKKLNVSETSIANLTKNNDDFFEILIHLFATNLQKVIKNDLNKQYVGCEENLSYIKGKLQLSSHLRQNITSRHRFFMKYDEFSEDNLLNRILKYTTSLLIKSTRNFNNLKMLQELDQMFAEVAPQRVQADDFKKVILTRLNSEYEPILNLAKVFISNSSLTLSSHNLETFSFIFNMNVLFEEFIGEFIKRELGDNFAKVLLQKPGRYVVEKKIRNDMPPVANIFALKPDIQLFHANKVNPSIIIDTKYKITLDPDDKKEGVSQADLYQMYMYSRKFGCKDVILLYPSSNVHVDNNVDFKLDSGTNVIIRTVNLCRDLKICRGELRQELEKMIGEVALSSFGKASPL